MFQSETTLLGAGEKGPRTSLISIDFASSPPWCFMAFETNLPENLFFSRKLHEDVRNTGERPPAREFEWPSSVFVITRSDANLCGVCVLSFVLLGWRSAVWAETENPDSLGSGSSKSCIPSAPFQTGRGIKKRTRLLRGKPITSTSNKDALLGLGSKIAQLFFF